MKSTKLKISTDLNWITLGYLILVTLLAIIGVINFGHGLGNLVYILFLGLVVITQLILTAIINRKSTDNSKYTWLLILATIFLAIAAQITLEFTFGRGAEYKWNGYIFYN